MHSGHYPPATQARSTTPFHKTASCRACLTRPTHPLPCCLSRCVHTCCFCCCQEACYQCCLSAIASAALVRTMLNSPHLLGLFSGCGTEQTETFTDLSLTTVCARACVCMHGGNHGHTPNHKFYTMSLRSLRSIKRHCPWKARLLLLFASVWNVLHHRQG